MATNQTQLFNMGSDGLTKIDTIMTQEANRIGPDIHRRTVHTSPWMDLIRQTKFPDGMGYILGTLIYDRALPTTTANGSTLGMNWSEVGQDPQVTKQTGNTLDQILVDARDTNIGAQTGKSFIQFARQLKQYSLKRAIVESPRINVEDLRFAAYRTEQLRAVMDALTESTKYSWEERYRDEYDRMCANIVVCKTTGTTTISSGKEGVQSWDVDLNGDPTANISNKVLDSLYFRLVRAGAGTNAYGRENARPVFGLVLSSEASYQLITEAGMLDNYRYNNSKVSELIAPLGIERSHKGYYHLIDDLAPRFEADTDTDGAGPDVADGTLNRVHPYTATNGIIALNPAYETSTFEAAYLLHQDVMESQIPDPVTGGSGVTFDPVNYRGKFAWKNIPHEITNPDGTNGFFRGVLASASKPIRTEFGYVILFDRTASAPAA